MKTLNGAPQFEENELLTLEVALLPEDYVNEQLREWAESRRCVRCALYDNEDHGFCNYFSSYTQETFSCAAFSPIETAGGKDE